MTVKVDNINILKSSLCIITPLNPKNNPIRTNNTHTNDTV